MSVIDLPGGVQVSDGDFVVVQHTLTEETAIYRVELNNDWYKIIDVDPDDAWIEARQSSGDTNSTEVTKKDTSDRNGVSDWFQDQYPPEDYEYEVRSKYQHIAQTYLNVSVQKFEKYLERLRENIFGRE